MLQNPLKLAERGVRLPRILECDRVNITKPRVTPRETRRIPEILQGLSAALRTLPEKSHRMQQRRIPRRPSQRVGQHRPRFRSGARAQPENRGRSRDRRRVLIRRKLRERLRCVQHAKLGNHHRYRAQSRCHAARVHHRDLHLEHARSALIDLRMAGLSGLELQEEVSRYPARTLVIAARGASVRVSFGVWQSEFRFTQSSIAQTRASPQPSRSSAQRCSRGEGKTSECGPDAGAMPRE
jgi:hypothetical protein